MARQLHEFLDALSDDGELLTQYDEDPEGTMTKFGLGDEEKQLLRSGTNKQIRDKLKEEVASHGAYVIRMVMQP